MLPKCAPALLTRLSLPPPPPPPPPTRGAARQIKAANAIKIIPQSRGRSMLWLATPVFIAALWGFNTMSARNTRKMHNR